MLIAAPVNSQLATQAVRRAIQAGSTLIAAPGAVAAVSAINHEGDAPGSRELLQRLLGRVLPAVVLARLDDTEGIVDIAGERYSVAARLPESGQSVLLRFAGSANPTAAATAAACAAGNSAPSASAPVRGAAQVVLGSLAQQLSEFAASDARPLALGPVAANVQTVPAFAAALGALVRDSGMFYESHLALWSRGQYPLSRLQREPQAVAAPATVAAASSTGRAHEHAAHNPMAAPTQAALVTGELQAIVREQLDLLEHRAMCVTIEAWPGQALQLDMRQRSGDDEARQDAPEGAGDEAVWATRLALELPHLGKLAAHIGLAGDRLQLVIHAGASASDRLSSNASLLTDALANAGIRLCGLRIQP